jgi:hypothetical protein
MISAMYAALGKFPSLRMFDTARDLLAVLQLVTPLMP